MVDAAGWQPDVLGPAYEALTLPLADDDEGPVVATLVRRAATNHGGARFLGDHLRPTDRHPLAGADVLYVHGWSDYFFQTEMAERIEDLGARFHALDLRKYGRSLLPHQTPGYTSDLAVYDEEIAAALAVMGHDGTDADRRRLVLFGHSTGGLTLSLWADRHPGVADGLILNSPWLEFQARSVGRELLTPFMRLGARRNPLAPLPTIDPGFYTRTVSSGEEGSWTYEQEWRPDRGFPLHPGWLSAVFAGQDRVSRGLHVTAPAIVLLSSHSLLQPRWDERMSRSDVALDVDVVAHRSLSLGDHVTIVRLPGALHDVFLSAEDVRAGAYTAIGRWARAVPRRRVS